MQPQSIDEWQRHEDAREARELRWESRMVLEDLSIPLAEDEEEPEPECQCVQVDVDEVNAQHCPAHGPHSPAAREQRQAEADAEFAYWANPAWEAVFGDAVPGGKPVQSVAPARSEAA